MLDYNKEYWFNKNDDVQSVVANDQTQAGQLSVWKPRLVAMKISTEKVRNPLTTQAESFKRLNLIGW
jgi:hypothetical protein